MTDHVTAYVPLFRFSCETDAFAVAPGVRLQRSSMPAALDLKALSDHEKHELLRVGYWLVLDEHATDCHSAAERMNRWAFALWLVGSTRVDPRSAEHTYEHPSLMRLEYTVCCLTKKTNEPSLHFHC